MICSLLGVVDVARDATLAVGAYVGVLREHVKGEWATVLGGSFDERVEEARARMEAQADALADKESQEGVAEPDDVWAAQKSASLKQNATIRYHTSPSCGSRHCFCGVGQVSAPGVFPSSGSDSSPKAEAAVGEPAADGYRGQGFCGARTLGRVCSRVVGHAGPHSNDYGFAWPNTLDSAPGVFPPSGTEQSHELCSITEDADGCGFKATCVCGRSFSTYTEEVGAPQPPVGAPTIPKADEVVEAFIASQEKRGEIAAHLQDALGDNYDWAPSSLPPCAILPFFHDMKADDGSVTPGIHHGFDWDGIVYDLLREFDIRKK